MNISLSDVHLRQRAVMKLFCVSGLGCSSKDSRLPWIAILQSGLWLEMSGYLEGTHLQVMRQICTGADPNATVCKPFTFSSEVMSRRNFSICTSGLSEEVLAIHSWVFTNIFVGVGAGCALYSSPSAA